MEKPMDCAGVREVLPLYVDEGCEPTVAGAVRDHLDGCAACSAAAKQAVAVRGLLQRQPPLHAPEALWAAISERVSSANGHGAPATTRTPFRLWRPKVLSIAAATLLGIGIGFYVGRSHNAAPSVAPKSLHVVDVSSPEGLEVAFLLAEHGRTGDAPAFSTHPAVFIQSGDSPGH